MLPFYSIALFDKPKKFETDRVDLYLDACVTSGLTSYKLDFIEGAFIKKDLGNVTTIVGASKILSHGIACCIILNDCRKTAYLNVLINYPE